ncbi:hypothetical protein ACN20G_14935 [Streptomyces sp. BI20]|uniref:hypothetical protein n=1 Tax=Streptomyces sp. BI20 TaxID=3403460 RepID=UPI003C77F0A1
MRHNPTPRTRARFVVPSVLAAVILSGAAAAPAVAQENGAEQARSWHRQWTPNAAEQVERAEQAEPPAARAAAGPIEDLLSSLTSQLDGILKSIGAALPAGTKLPDVKLPTVPTVPELPSIPGVEMPKLPTVQLPALPAMPQAPAAPQAPAGPAGPEVPALPELP